MMFNLGNLIATKNVYLNMQESSCFAYDVKNCFEQFKNKNWGDLSEEDWNTLSNMVDQSASTEAFKAKILVWKARSDTVLLICSIA